MRKCLLFRQGRLSGSRMADTRVGGETVLWQRGRHKQRPGSRLVPGGAADVHAAPGTHGRAPWWCRGNV